MIAILLLIIAVFGIVAIQILAIPVNIHL